MGNPRFKISNTRQLLKRVLSYRYFSGPKPPIPYIYRAADSATPLILVTGENAGGKSFFRRIVSGVCSFSNIESIPISMEGRRQVSYNPMLVFVYGDEEHEATGINSIETVLRGISTCQSRTEPHAVVWDEPDIGLSDGNAASVGHAIAEFAAKASPLTRAIVVITHRKALAKELLPLNPHYLYLGDTKGPGTLAEWLAAPPVIRPLSEVVEASRKRWKAIQKAIDNK